MMNDEAAHGWSAVDQHSSRFEPTLAMTIVMMRARSARRQAMTQIAAEGS